MIDHLNNIIRLFTATCKVIQGKLQELKSSVDSLCGEVNASLPPTPIRNTWTSVPKTNVAFNNLHQAATFSYIIPSVIPSDANNILILAFSGLGPPKNGLTIAEGDIIIFQEHAQLCTEIVQVAIEILTLGVEVCRDLSNRY